MMKNMIKLLFLGKHSALAALVVLVTLCSCFNSHKGSDAKHSDVSTEVKSFRVNSPDSVHQLQSYYLSAADGDSVLYAYNYVEHAIDVFRDSVFIQRIQLDQHGENAIPGRLIAMTLADRHSMWVFDGVSFSLLRDDGKVIKRHHEERFVFAESNYAMSTSMIGWHEDNLLLYPVDDNGEYKIVYYDILRSQIQKEVVLDFPSSNPKGKNKYADMKYPNITYANGKIIYNYPYDSSVFTIDIISEARSSNDVCSKFGQQSLQPFPGSNDFQEWQRYDWANDHYYEVAYLDEPGVYVRVLSGGVDPDKQEDINTVVDARPLYLTIMDADFNVISEERLPENRYNNYHGWFSSKDAMILYVDNQNGEVHDQLHYDSYTFRLR